MTKSLSEIDFYKNYTLIEALAELYDFNPKRKKKSQIVFELTDKGVHRWLRFGKYYNNIEHKWQFFEQARDCPCLNCEEKHFVSNLMCYSFAKDRMTYGAQQGTFEVHNDEDAEVFIQKEFGTRLELRNIIRQKTHPVRLHDEVSVKEG